MSVPLARPEALETAFAKMLGPAAVVVAEPATAGDHGLLPEEQIYIARAIDRRRRAFAGGRRAARAALITLGEERAALPAGPDRAPIWPEGIVGSITHDDSDCVAALARSSDFLSLGIDIEPATPLVPELWPSVATLEEIAGAADHPGLGAKLVFSAKEAAYKCQYPLTGTLLDFRDLKVSVDRAAMGFTAVFCRPARGFAEGARIDGAFRFTDGRIATAAWIPDQAANGTQPEARGAPPARAIGSRLTSGSDSHR